MENEKLVSILAACFAGGAATVLLALVWAVGPFGLAACALAGATVGYLGYRPRQTWQGAVRASKLALGGVWTAFGLVRAFFAEPRVYFWASLFATVSLAAALQMSAAGEQEIPVGPFVFIHSWVVAIIGIGFWLFPTGALGLTFMTKQERLEAQKRWPSLFRFDSRSTVTPAWNGIFSVMDARSVADLWWTMTMIWMSAYAEMFRVLLWFVWTCLCVIPRFALELFRAIHRRARVMCMVDGPLGGILAYAVGQSAFAGELAWANPVAQTAFILLGGALGIAVGYLNYKVVAPLLGEQPT